MVYPKNGIWDSVSQPRSTRLQLNVAQWSLTDGSRGTTQYWMTLTYLIEPTS